MCVALFAGLPCRGTRRKETGDVVWTLQFRPIRGDHCVRVGIIGHVLGDALRLMRIVCNDMPGWSSKHIREIFVRWASLFLREEMQFCCDGPALAADRWLKEIEAAPFMYEVRTLIQMESGLRLLGETG